MFGYWVYCVEVDEVFVVWCVLGCVVVVFFVEFGV